MMDDDGKPALSLLFISAEPQDDVVRGQPMSHT